MVDWPKDCLPVPAFDIIDERNALRNRVAELESALTKSASREAALAEKLKVAEEVVAAARGLSFGEDWNNGTHAKIYRPALLAALAKIKEASCNR